MTIPMQLSVAGIDMTPTLPPPDSLTVTPVRAGVTHTLLNGQSVTQLAEQIGHWLITLAPPDGYVCTPEVKRAVEAACWAGTPITLIESLSDTEQVRSWTGRVVECEFRERPHSRRRFYHYRIVLQQEEPL